MHRLRCPPGWLGGSWLMHSEGADMHPAQTALVAGPYACQAAGQLGIYHTDLVVMDVPGLAAAALLLTRRSPAWLVIALADLAPTTLRLFRQTQHTRLSGVIVIAGHWLCAYRGQCCRLSRRAPRTPAGLQQLLAWGAPDQAGALAFID